MKVIFDKSFSKSLDKLKDRQIKERLETLIVAMDNADHISDIHAIKPLKGHTGFYRIRMGDYRVGFELITDDEILLILIAHRKDIYKRFP